jgi:hypothetical protein
MNPYREPSELAIQKLSLRARVKDWFCLNLSIFKEIGKVVGVIFLIVAGITLITLPIVTCSNNLNLRRTRNASRLLGVPANVIDCGEYGRSVHFKDSNYYQCRFLQNGRLTYSNVYCSNNECLRNQ